MCDNAIVDAYQADVSFCCYDHIWCSDSVPCGIYRFSDLSHAVLIIHVLNFEE